LKKKKGLKIKFDKHPNISAETYHKADYERGVDFDAPASHNEWILEEPDEHKRQCFVRWEHFEATKQNMPEAGGDKCIERVEFEAIEAKRAEEAAAAAEAKAERARLFKEARAKKKAEKEAAAAAEAIENLAAEEDEDYLTGDEDDEPTNAYADAAHGSSVEGESPFNAPETKAAFAAAAAAAPTAMGGMMAVLKAAKKWRKQTKFGKVHHGQVVHHTDSTAHYTHNSQIRKGYLAAGAKERADGALVLKDGSTFLKSGHLIKSDGTIVEVD
jgi:hypothetical protein